MAGLVEAQYGVVARRQLLGLGMSTDAIKHRLKAGRLHRLHAGVYAVGHRAIRQEGTWMAAVLAGGEGAVLSHRSAAALWGLRAQVPARVEITSPRSTRSTSRLHRHRVHLPSEEVTVRNRIPVTTVSRTLFDLSAALSPSELERAIREAEVLRLPQRPPLAEFLGRYPRHRGARSLRKTLQRLSRLPRGNTRSSLEDHFLRFAARARLPMPETNAKIMAGGSRHEVDCLWRGERLILELDGHEVHGTRSAFESDRKRDRRLQAAGWTVVRVTYRQLDEPGDLARDIRLLLRRQESNEGAVSGAGNAQSQFRAVRDNVRS